MPSIPLSVSPVNVLTPADIARFWSKVDRSGGPDACWPWTGYRRTGYGMFCVTIPGVGRRCLSAHRTALELTNGPLPPDKYACHDCPGGDNRACCNPAHLWPGTNQENQLDAVRKGQHGSTTHPESRPRGAANTASKVNEQAVREIRALYAAGGVTYDMLGARYGVARTTIKEILHRHNWAWVE